MKNGILKKTGANSRYVSTEPVTEEWEGKIIWSGLVHKFELFNHPDSNFCYVWAETRKDSKTQRINIVLDGGKTEEPIDALNAVRIYLRHRIEEDTQ